MDLIFLLLSMWTNKLNTTIEKATCCKVLWVCAPLIISSNTFLLVGKGLLQIVMFFLLLSQDQIHWQFPLVCDQFCISFYSEFCKKCVKVIVICKLICVCVGKYFLVDAGYPNVPRFLALYWCTCYHLKEFSRENPINTPWELFNQ